MTWSINGCGTNIVPARSIVRWRRGWFVPTDFDGVECFCLFYLPLIPYDAVHAYDWYKATKDWNWRTGERDDTDYCQSLEIRWDLDLVVRAFLRRWVGAAAWMLCMFEIALVFGVVSGKVRLTEALGALCGLFPFALASLVVMAFLWISDQRRRRICRVLGPAEVYGGDPASWTSDRLERYGTARGVFGTSNFTDAVIPLLHRREFARAMLAARLALRCDPFGRDAGEALTDAVLAMPEVQQALSAVESDPANWHHAMNNGAARRATV